uniref:CA domain-containing protein n=1 Tax=Macrostomum lignano TaxID=282301 RepID=A0A1I8JJN1_9PLAT
AETAGLKRQRPDFPAGQPAGGSAGGRAGRRISSPDFLAADPDQGDNSRLTYRLESDDDEFSFALENSNRRPVVLKTNRALDREKTDSYSLRLLAVDNGRPQRTGTLSITVLVLDINDETPVFEKSLYVASVPENAPKNTPVVTVRAVDGDQGANGRVSYRISRE